MYLVGNFHVHKTDAQRLVEKLLTERERLVTDAEVFQEILHRYTAIRRREVIRPAFDTLLGMVEDVIPVDLAVMELARDLTLSYPRISARDAVHVAVMQRVGIEAILSFDGGFDGIPGVTRVS